MKLLDFHTLLQLAAKEKVGKLHEKTKDGSFTPGKCGETPVEVPMMIEFDYP